MRTPPLWLRIGGVGGAVTVAAVVATSAVAGPVDSSHHEARASADAPVVRGGAAAPQAGARQSDPAPLARLSARQLAGQRVIYSYPGLNPPARLLSLIRHGEAAGVIFFAPNIASSAQIKHVIARLDRANASASNPDRAMPLLLMTDQEGGEVRRLPGPPYLSEQQIGETANPAAAARAAGRSAARNLRSIGMNVNLAPVLDVYRQADGFDGQYGRSYSSNPQAVSALGSDFIRAQQAAGVAATPKEFPGLGAASASQDTDTGPVTLPLSLATLRSVDEFPYRAAITAGAKLVMVSWGVYPALSSLPAGFSAAVVQGELRHRLGFTGVTMTDALEAGALSDYGSFGHRAVLAASAGMDLILCSAQSTGEGAQARAALQRAYQDSRLGRTAFRQAVAQILALRASVAR